MLLDDQDCAVASPNAPKGVNLVALHEWDIVIPEDASPSEVHAAEEFQNLAAQVTPQPATPLPPGITEGRMMTLVSREAVGSLLPVA